MHQLVRTTMLSSARPGVSATRWLADEPVRRGAEAPGQANACSAVRAATRDPRFAVELDGFLSEMLGE